MISDGEGNMDSLAREEAPAATGERLTSKTQDRALLDCPGQRELGAHYRRQGSCQML